MSCVFEAATAGGALRIALAQPAGDAVSAALALAEHEALIVALEAWLQQPLDLHPLTSTAAAANADTALLWARCGALRLGFAWSLLLNAASVPSASALPIEWPELAFEIDVAGFSTDPRPVDAQPANAPADARSDAHTAALLLPPSFEPAWRVALQGVGATGANAAANVPPPPLWADAEWRGPGTALELCGAPQSGAPRRAAWRVQLDACYQRSLPELLGWITPAAPADADADVPDVPDVPARLSGAAHLIAPGQPPRRGRIAPALGGAGLWISG